MTDERRAEIRQLMESGRKSSMGDLGPYCQAIRDLLDENEKLRKEADEAQDDARRQFGAHVEFTTLMAYQEHQRQEGKCFCALCQKWREEHE